MQLTQVILESTLTCDREPSLALALRQGRFNRVENRITGLILCSGSFILEVLEGERTVVLNASQHIRSDARYRVTDYSESAIAERFFTRWNSGYRRSNAVAWEDHTTLYDAYQFDGIDASLLRHRRGPLLERLLAFSLQH